MTSYSAAGQVEAGLRYIRETYGEHSPDRLGYASGGIISGPAAGDQVPLRLDSCNGGMLTSGQAATFYEEDEDPEKVFAAYGAGPNGLTAPSQAQARGPYSCGFCERGQCGRCSDKRCACCAGNPEG